MGIELLTPYTKVELDTKQTKKRRQIGLFLGKFAPIHVAHLVIADQVRRELNLERILFMPEFDDKNGTIISMLSHALNGHDGFGIDMSRLNNRAQTLLETLQELTENHEDTDFYFIIGSDMVDYLSQYEDAVALASLVQLVGVQRPGFRTGTSLPILWVDVPQIAISSTGLRDMMHQGITPQFLVPDAVLDFIKKRSLYGL